MLIFALVSLLTVLTVSLNAAESTANDEMSPMSKLRMELMGGVMESFVAAKAKKDSNKKSSVYRLSTDETPYSNGYVTISGYSDDSCSATVEQITAQLGVCIATEIHHETVYIMFSIDVFGQDNYLILVGEVFSDDACTDSSTSTTFRTHYPLTCGVGTDENDGIELDSAGFYTATYSAVEADLPSIPSVDGVVQRLFLTHSQCKGNHDARLFMQEWFAQDTCYKTADGAYQKFSCDGANDRVLLHSFTAEDDCMKHPHGTVKFRRNQHACKSEEFSQPIVSSGSVMHATYYAIASYSCHSSSS